ncbi:MAG: hypothetical protein M1835_004635 [Candelina submexicana]|nr:MAG: hypothetical protein M1835_004635 [Candelina submexicana]
MFRSSQRGEKSSKFSSSGSTRRSTKGSSQGSAGGPSQADDKAVAQSSVGQVEQEQSSIPSGLSFVFRIDPLEPDFSVQVRLGYPRLGFWQPPTVSRAYTRTTGEFYRWKDGRIAPATDINLTTPLYSFRTATVFSQETDTSHLLAVEYDATTEDVAGNLKGEWQPLNFQQKRDYSYINCHGDMTLLPFPGSATWMPQLVPYCYNCRDTDRAAAGLVGKLPLLISLVAFSCSPDPRYMDHVLKNHVLPREWRPHNYPSGRVPDRGMIVSTFYDPASEFYFTEQHLLSLEDGEYGPMFAP